MPNPPLLNTLRQRKRQLAQAAADFRDLLVRVNLIGTQTPPNHPRFALLLSLYEQLSELISTLETAKSRLQYQIDLLSRA